ncbi:MAG: reprolysin-like metallopeptidase, partial [Bacteroidota bacterium]
MHRLSLAAVVAALVALAAAPAQAQTGLWSDVSDATLAKANRVTVPQAYRTVRLDAPQMRQRLAAAPAESQVGKASSGTALSLPLPEGGFVEVRVVESSILAPELQARYPQIRTYLASGPGSVHGRLSQTPQGFRGMLFAPGGAIYIDPYAPGDTQHYIVYRAQDLVVDPILRGRIADRVEGEAHDHEVRSPAAARPHGETLRTYRLAVAATGEYTQFHGGTVAAAMAAITTTMNRVTGIYERDLSVRFELVANNDQVVYTNGGTDPYSNNNGSAMLNQNINNLNSVIG